jgi:tetratricopeptide (TPR) repeat protein
MSLLLDALKRAELAKRQQAAAAAGEVYPPLALQEEGEAAAPEPVAGQNDAAEASVAVAGESAFAAGLALEPVDTPAHASSTRPAEALPPNVPPPSESTLAARPAEAESAASPASLHVADAAPASGQHAVAIPEAQTPPESGVLSSSPLAARFGAAVKPPATPVEPPAESLAVAATATANVTPPAQPAATGAAPGPSITPPPGPDAARRVMANKPSRKPVNRSAMLLLGGLLLLGASGGYLWWQMQSPVYTPDPALASDPLAASMADATANTAAAPADAAVNSPAQAPAADVASRTAMVAPKPDAAPRPGVSPPAVTRSAQGSVAAPVPAPGGKKLEIRQDTPEETVDANIQSGYKAYLAGDFSAARSAYARALQAYPHHRDALLGLAAVAVRQGNPEEAERWYRKQLQQDPLDDMAKAGLAGIARGLDARERESALRNMGEAVAGSAQTAVQLGNLYASEKRWPDAQQQYFRALTLEPENPDHAFNLAVSLEHLDQPKLALDYYRKAQSLAAQRKPAFDPAELKSRIEALGQP